MNLEETIRAKEAHRRVRAALSFPEKIRIIVEMQKRRAPIVAQRGGKQRIWDLKFVDRVTETKRTPD